MPLLSVPFLFFSFFFVSVCVCGVVVQGSLVARHDIIIVKIIHFKRNLPNP